jgi:hypothetical protein
MTLFCRTPYRVLQSASTKVREYLHEFVADGDAGELHGGDDIGRLRNLCVRAHESSDSETCGREQIESERREVRLTHVRQALQQTVVAPIASPARARTASPSPQRSRL